MKRIVEFECERCGRPMSQWDFEQNEVCPDCAEEETDYDLRTEEEMSDAG